MISGKMRKCFHVSKILFNKKHKDGLKHDFVLSKTLKYMR